MLQLPQRSSISPVVVIYLLLVLLLLSSMFSCYRWRIIMCVDVMCVFYLSDGV